MGFPESSIADIETGRPLRFRMSGEGFMLLLSEAVDVVLDGLSGHTTAYHCGSSRGDFSFRYTGTGEGLGALGPGIYFSSTPEMAN